MMITRSKKNKTTFTTNPQTSSSFDGLPLDLYPSYGLPSSTVEILFNLFPLVLVLLNLKGTHYAKEDWYFFSSSFLSRSSCPLPPVYHSHYVKGLLCIGSGREQFIVNPTSEPEEGPQKVFFGYDQVNDEYKVLCMTEALSSLHAEGPSSQHQFHLITRVPTEIVLSKDQYSHDMIINYQGKVAIPTKTSTYTFDVWVMVQNAEERKWLKKLTFSVEPWKSSCRFIYFKGITQTGEFIMAPYCYDSENVYVALYNHYTDTLRKIKVQVSADFNFKPNLPGIFFSDYIECVRFL
ncbi:hypothetical protein HID58_089025 [Brassica napus]|uniref:F-box associated beta-propeller type 3 domain-containing protein n=1 Tax=Brassica napus TaxID=3708 RepID=A0ABQ7XXV1_BRANA|nr:hypothetical protein HID58_089025 [Brassica napus]